MDSLVSVLREYDIRLRALICPDALEHIVLMCGLKENLESSSTPSTVIVSLDLI